jgi:hypothetical protein
MGSYTGVGQAPAVDRQGNALDEIASRLDKAMAEFMEVLTRMDNAANRASGPEPSAVTGKQAAEPHALLGLIWSKFDQLGEIAACQRSQMGCIEKII